MTTERLDIVVTETGAKKAADTINQIAAAGEKAERSTAAANKQLSLMDSGAARLRQSFSGLPGILTTVGTVVGTAFSASKLIEYADSFTNIQNQLRRTVKDTAGLTAATNEVYAISQRTRTSFSENVGTFTRLQTALQGMNKDTKLAGPLLETIAQSMAVSGTSADAAKSGMIQFQQALQGGALRGEEFNSIVENTPGLLGAIAVGMRVPIGQLRAMAEQGQLTSRTLIEALQKAGPAAAASFANVVPTVSSALQVLNNAFVRYMGEEAQGPVRLLAQGIIGLGNNMQTVVPIVLSLGAAIAGILALQFAVWLGGVVIGLGALAIGAASAALALAPIVLTFGALAAGAVFLISKVVDLGKVWESLKSTANSYTDQIKKVIDGDKKASTGSRNLDDILKSLNSTMGGTASGAAAAGGAVNQMGKEFSFAAQAGSLLEKQLAAVDAANQRSRQSYEETRQKIMQVTEAYFEMRAAAQSAAQVGMQSAEAMGAAFERMSYGVAEMQNAASSAQGRMESMRPPGAGYGYGPGGSNYMEGAAGSPYYFDGQKWTYKTTFLNFMAGATPTIEQRNRMDRDLEALNAGLPGGGAGGVVGGAGGTVPLIDAMSGLMSAMNDNTAVIKDLSGQLSPQGFDPRTMGRVEVPSTSSANDVSPYRLPAGLPAGYARSNITNVKQTVVIQTSNYDSFQRSRRQMAADARRALARG